MTWIKARKAVEQFFAPSVQGRVCLHQTAYRCPGRWNNHGRAWITIDGEEVINMAYGTDWRIQCQLPESLMEEAAQASRIGSEEFVYAIHDYRNLSIEEIVVSKSSVIRALGMLDRRVGTRRLRRFDVSREPALVKALYIFRCLAEGIEPKAAEELRSLVGELRRRRAVAYHRMTPEFEREQLEKSRMADVAMRRPRGRRLLTMVDQLLSGKRMGPVDRADLPRSEAARILHAACEAVPDGESLIRILSRVGKVTELLEDPAFLRGVCEMATQADHWLRPIAVWKPRSKNAKKQFASLARYLFANYHVPAFMDRAWTTGGKREQHWFRHLGLGQNLRTAPALPICVTRQIAHHFCMAPDHYSIEDAFRWGQVHSLGGDRRLADAIRGTRLSGTFVDDPFWVSVLRFFLANPMLDTAHIQPIVDYLWHQRFEPQIVVVEGGREETAPLQPHLSMRGRTAESLLAAVDAWHQRLASDSMVCKAEWKKSEMADLFFEERIPGSELPRRWSIVELLSSDELLSEGRAMRHCVASYARSCRDGQCSIWRMDVETNGVVDKRLTIEMHRPSGEIRQAKGRGNRNATEEEKRMLRYFADVRKVTIASYI